MIGVCGRVVIGLVARNTLSRNVVIIIHMAFGAFVYIMAFGKWKTGRMNKISTGPGKGSHRMAIGTFF